MSWLPRIARLSSYASGIFTLQNTGKRSLRQWTGYDINDVFVNYALERGHNAVSADILSLKKLPQADVLIFAGSLYHFNENLASHLAIDDIVCNKDYSFWANKKISLQSKISLEKFGARASAVRNGAEAFRFERDSLIEMLGLFQETYNFTYEIVSEKEGYF